MFFNPISDLFCFIYEYTNSFFAIVILTIIVKIIMTPIYIMRFKNTKLRIFLKNKIIQFEDSEKKISRKSINFLKSYIGMKDVKVIVFTSILELGVLFLLIGSFKNLNDKCYWFNIGKNDFGLSVLYIIILVINEIMEIKKSIPNDRVFQCVFSGILLIVMFNVVFKVKTSFLIYWIVSILFRMVLFRILEIFIRVDISNEESLVFDKVLINELNSKGCEI